MLNYYAAPGVRRLATQRQIKDIIINSTLTYYGKTWKQIDNISRKEDLKIVRQIIMYFLCMRTKMTLKDIGGIFRNKFDHTTVIHSREKIRDLITTGYLTTDINNIINLIER